MVDEPTVESEPPSRRRRNWRDPATITGVIAGLTALVAAIAALRQPAPQEKKAEAGYEVLVIELKRQNEVIQRMHADQTARWAWLRGFYKSQGVEITDVVAPSLVELELRAPSAEAPVVSMLKPSPSPSKPPKPVGVKVLTPLPKSAPRPATAALPSADAL
jgi:hypothetical protein